MQETIEVTYFPIWRRYAALFRDTGLTDAQKGKLLGFMMAYQFEGTEPETVPRSLAFAWPYLKKDLDDARRPYETSVRNGKKGGRPKKKTCEEAEENPEETQKNLEKGNTMSRSKSKTRTMSVSNINTGSAPAEESAGVGGEKKSYGEFGWIKLTDGQYGDLRQRMGEEELRRCITHVDELTQSTGNRNRWKDWYILIRRCHEQQWYVPPKPRSNPVPCGATGELGQAELEAIRQLMAENEGGR